MREQPQVVILTTAFYPHVGGAEMAVQEILPYLQKQVACTVLTARLDAALPREDSFAGVRIIRIGYGYPRIDKLLFMCCAWWQVRRIACAHRVVGIWAIMASYAGVAALITKWFCRIPFALTLQEGDDLQVVNQRVRPVRFIFKKIFTEATHIQAIASFLVTWAEQYGPLPQKPVVIPNGVAIDPFTISAQDRQMWREATRHALHIPPNASVVLTISRLVPKNGIADLITAVEHIPQAHLIVVGDGALRHALESQAASIASRVHFVGSCDRDAILRYASAADVFCRPSLSEGQGIVFMEAMALELPVIATQVGGIPETVVAGTGILVPPHEPSQLATALRTVFEDDPYRTQLIAAARRHVKSFDWKYIAPRIIEWLTSAFRLV